MAGRRDRGLAGLDLDAVVCGARRRRKPEEYVPAAPASPKPKKPKHARAQEQVHQQHEQLQQQHKQHEHERRQQQQQSRAKPRPRQKQPAVGAASKISRKRAPRTPAAATASTAVPPPAPAHVRGAEQRLRAGGSSEPGAQEPAPSEAEHAPCPPSAALIPQGVAEPAAWQYRPRPRPGTRATLPPPPHADAFRLRSLAPALGSGEAAVGAATELPCYLIDDFELIERAMRPPGDGGAGTAAAPLDGVCVDTPVTLRGTLRQSHGGAMEHIEVDGVVEWGVDYGQGGALWVATGAAWYVLGTASAAYGRTGGLTGALRKRDLTVRAAAALAREPGATYAQVLGAVLRGDGSGVGESSRQYAEADLIAEAPFVLAALGSLMPAMGVVEDGDPLPHEPREATDKSVVFVVQAPSPACGVTVRQRFEAVLCARRKGLETRLALSASGMRTPSAFACEGADVPPALPRPTYMHASMHADVVLIWDFMHQYSHALGIRPFSLRLLHAALELGPTTQGADDGSDGAGRIEDASGTLHVRLAAEEVLGDVHLSLVRGLESAAAGTFRTGAGSASHAAAAPEVSQRAVARGSGMRALAWPDKLRRALAPANAPLRALLQGMSDPATIATASEALDAFDAAAQLLEVLPYWRMDVQRRRELLAHMVRVLADAPGFRAYAEAKRTAETDARTALARLAESVGKPPSRRETAKSRKDKEGDGDDGGARPSPAPEQAIRALEAAHLKSWGTNLHEASDCTVLGCDSTGRAYLSLGGGGPTSAVVVQEPLTGSNGGRGNGDSDLYRWYEYGRACGSGDASGDGTAGAAASAASAQGCELRALEKALRASGERRIADAIAALPPARPSKATHMSAAAWAAAASGPRAWLAGWGDRATSPKLALSMWPLERIRSVLLGLLAEYPFWIVPASQLARAAVAEQLVSRARSAAELAAAVPAVLVAIEETHLGEGQLIPKRRADIEAALDRATHEAPLAQALALLLPKLDATPVASSDPQDRAEALGAGAAQRTTREQWQHRARSNGCHLVVPKAGDHVVVLRSGLKAQLKEHVWSLGPVKDAVDPAGCSVEAMSSMPHHMRCTVREVVFLEQEPRSRAHKPRRENPNGDVVRASPLPKVWMHLVPRALDLDEGNRVDQLTDAKLGNLGADSLPISAPMHMDSALPDFVVPENVFKAGMSLRWRRGQRFRMFYADDGESGQFWSGTVVKNHFHEPDGTGVQSTGGDPWECIEVAWDNEDYRGEHFWVNPWELEALDEPDRDAPAPQPKDAEDADGVGVLGPRVDAGGGAEVSAGVGSGTMAKEDAATALEETETARPPET